MLDSWTARAAWLSSRLIDSIARPVAARMTSAKMASGSTKPLRSASLHRDSAEQRFIDRSTSGAKRFSGCGAKIRRAGRQRYLGESGRAWSM